MKRPAPYPLWWLLSLPLAGAIVGGGIYGFFWHFMPWLLRIATTALGG